MARAVENITAPDPADRRVGSLRGLSGPQHRRIRWASLTALLLLGPGLATLLVWRAAPSTPVDLVVPLAEEPLEDGLEVRAALESVDVRTGRARVSLDVSPRGAWADGVRLARNLDFAIATAAGPRIDEYRTGDVVTTLSVDLALTGSRVSRYPFDRYQVALFFAATDGQEPPGPVPVDFSLVAPVAEFDTELSGEPLGEPHGGARSLTVSFGRPLAVKVWAGFFVFFVWAIALGAASVAWVVVLYGQRVPFWAWAFFISILFALPPLRDGLPNAPPFGSLIDWGAFYWSIAVVVLSLLAVLVAWNLDIRATLRGLGPGESSERAAPDPPGEG